jgi:hypothetical protein
MKSDLNPGDRVRLSPRGKQVLYTGPSNAKREIKGTVQRVSKDGRTVDLVLDHIKGAMTFETRHWEKDPS